MSSERSPRATAVFRSAASPPGDWPTPIRAHTEGESAATAPFITMMAWMESPTTVTLFRIAVRFMVGDPFLASAAIPVLFTIPEIVLAMRARLSFEFPLFWMNTPGPAEELLLSTTLPSPMPVPPIRPTIVELALLRVPVKTLSGEADVARPMMVELFRLNIKLVVGEAGEELFDTLNPMLFDVNVAPVTVRSMTPEFSVAAWSPFAKLLANVLVPVNAAVTLPVPRARIRNPLLPGVVGRVVLNDEFVTESEDSVALSLWSTKLSSCDRDAETFDTMAVPETSQKWM